MARLKDVFFDTSVLVAGMVDLGAGSQGALTVLDAVADGRVDDPKTAWHCCLEFFSVTTRLPEEYRTAGAIGKAGPHFEGPQARSRLPRTTSLQASRP